MTTRSVSLGKSGPLLSAGNQLIARISQLWRAWMARRQVAGLLDADERMLADIGLTRADVIGSLSSPIDVDPSHQLIRARDERRSSRLRRS